MSLLDNLDPVRLFGLEAPKEVPRSAMREIEKGRSHINGVFVYYHHAGKIVRENILFNGRLTFYEPNGKQCFYN